MNDTFNKQTIEGHEGRELRAYHDSRGFLTIGVGCNLDTANAAAVCQRAGIDYAAARNGAAITDAQCEALFDEQYSVVAAQARHIFPAIDTWPANAAAVACDLLFELGLTKFLKFTHTIASFTAKDWPGAAQGIEDSLLETEVPNRVKDNVALLEAIR